MNLKHIIAEEFVQFLQEADDAQVLAGLDKLIQEVPVVIPELEKVVADNILPYLSSLAKGPLKEADEEPEEVDQQGQGAAEVAKEMGAHAAKTAAMAPKVAGYVLSHLPGGKKTGIMIATALDKTTDDHVRNAVLFALGNLIAGSLGLELPDLGDFLQRIPEIAWEKLPFTDNDQNWDWGALNAADDASLLTWAWLKVKKAVDVEEKLHEFGKFVGRSNLGKQPELAGAGDFDRDDMSLDAKAARAGAAAEQGKKFRGIKEMKIKKSEIYKMIKEELEVVLTNEEAVEIFDLDMSALLDEMMNEDELPTDKTDGRWDGEKMDPRRSKHDKPGVKGLARRRGARGRQQAAKEDLEEAQLDEKDNWMKDIKSTGECTPYTKPGCKGRAKAFAKRAQHGDVRDDNLKKGKNPHGPG